MLNTTARNEVISVRQIRKNAPRFRLAALLLALLLCGCQPASAAPETQTLEVVYAGVSDYGTISAEAKDTFQYRFYQEDTELLFSMDNGAADPVTGAPYALQNLLMRGYSYQITVQDGKVTQVQPLPEADAPHLTTPVSGTPGLKTVKNLLATALMPVGRTLYVYGGGWNWQDDGASAQARSIGIAASWVTFFNKQTAEYHYRAKDPAVSYYPYGKWNEYYYAGLDCSGYVGWALYNVMHQESGGAGYVMSAGKMAKAFAGYGWGTWSRDALTPAERQLLPGDIVSKPGHVWICLGTCEDGSVVFAHASPTESRTGGAGGGVQLSALGSSTDCQAYRLADHYMKTYYPDWYARYPVALKDFAEYTAFAGSDTLGRFTWDTESDDACLTDPEGIRNLSADRVLALLFGETE